MFRCVLSVAFIMATVAACAPQAPASPQASQTPGNAASPAGAALLQPFKQELQQALRAGLAEGPEQAIAACRLRAPEIAAALSVDGVRMGRSSHRLRNPANVAPDWVAPVLDAYAASTTGLQPVTVELQDNRAGYIEPIVAQPLCLTCHGENLAGDIAARLAELYPDDQATGYRAGDLRGVFWVDYPR